MCRHRICSNGGDDVSGIVFSVIFELLSRIERGDRRPRVIKLDDLQILIDDDLDFRLHLKRRWRNGFDDRCGVTCGWHV